MAPGDRIITAPLTRTRPLGWHEPARGPGDPPPPAEKPELVHALVHEHLAFEVRATLDACFAEVRSIFISDGGKGVERFFKANGMAKIEVPAYAGREDFGEHDPEDFLHGDRLLVYRLLNASRTRVRKLAASAVEQVGKLAMASARARLDVARAEIDAELRRYFTGKTGRSLLDVALDDRVSERLYELDPTAADVAHLRGEIRVCRRLIATATAAEQRWAKPYLRAYGEARSQLVGPLDDEPIQLRESIDALAERNHPELTGLRAAADAARERVHAHIAVAALEFPILWRVFATEHVDDLPALGAEMLAILRRANAANRELATELRRDPDLVWRFPSVVREALRLAYVPHVSIAWMAAEEELARVAGPRLSSQLGMLTGLGALGHTALAAMVGATAATPPLAVALAVTDGLVALWDALEEYLEYRRQRAAADAVLDPSRSLANEPSLLGAMFTIALDVVGAIPATGPARAVAP